MRNFKVFCSTASILMLAACGGGSGTGLNSTPPPALEPVSKSASLINVTQNDDFAASAYSTKFTISSTTGGVIVTNNNGVISTGTNGGIANTAVHYDASSKTYSMQLTGISTDSKLAFGDENKVAAKSNDALSTYEKTTGSRSETLLLFNPGPSNTKLALTYTSYGAWLTTEKRSNGVDTNVAFFTFGTRTSPADMPRTGSASYSTILDGIFTDDAGFYAVTGSGSVSANFAASTLTYQVNPVSSASATSNAAPRDFGSFNGNGTINSTTAGFTTSESSSNGYSFGMNGYFYGPGAAELGAAFHLSGYGATGTGAVVGKKD